MDLLKILEKHKALVSVKLEPGSTYNEYWANLKFTDNKITVEIIDDEGGHHETDEIEYAWFEIITKVVNDLKEAKAIPDYTLELLTPPTTPS